MTRMTDFCDITCDECLMWKPGTEAGTNDQRKILARDGWTKRNGPTGRLEDICPACTGKVPDYWFHERINSRST